MRALWGAAGVPGTSSDKHTQWRKSLTTGYNGTEGFSAFFILTVQSYMIKANRIFNWWLVYKITKRHIPGNLFNEGNPIGKFEICPSTCLQLDREEHF